MITTLYSKGKDHSKTVTRIIKFNTDTFEVLGDSNLYDSGDMANEKQVYTHDSIIEHIRSKGSKSLIFKH